MAKIYPVIMCGGSGTRLWPLSTVDKPKQYQPITSEISMLRETIRRVRNTKRPDLAPPSFICALQHEPFILEACREEDIQPHQILLEPCARNTAAVAACAAISIAEEDPQALVLLLPADHHIEDVDGFWRAIELGETTALKAGPVTFGIRPSKPETGYGYIKAGKLNDKTVYHVDAFVEKPDLNTALEYLASGDYYWNAGIFLFSPTHMINAFKRYAPSILNQSQHAIQNGQRKGPSLHLDPASFSACEKNSIDYAIMEKADNVFVVSSDDIGWSDIGSWDSLRDRAILQNNLLQGATDIIEIDCSNTFVKTNEITIAAIGLEDIIIVATPGAVLVTKAGQSQNVKGVVEKLGIRSNERSKK